MRIFFVVVLLALLPACATDKLLHASAGLGIGLASDTILGDYGCEMAIAAGIAKELIDPVFSTLDVIATSMYCLTEVIPDEVNFDPATIPDNRSLFQY